MTFLHRVGPDHGFTSRYKTTLSESVLQLSLIYAEQLRDDYESALVNDLAHAIAVNSFVLAEGQIAQVQYSRQ